MHTIISIQVNVDKDTGYPRGVLIGDDPNFPLSFRKASINEVDKILHPEFGEAIRMLDTLEGDLVREAFKDLCDTLDRLEFSGTVDGLSRVADARTRLGRLLNQTTVTNVT